MTGAESPTRPPDPASPPPPSARFQVVHELGRGTSGVVYLARDARVGADVALKTFLKPEPERLRQLKDEFRILADIVHPNLVRLHDLVVDEITAFLSMEYVDGVPFTAFVRPESPSVDAGDSERVARLQAAGAGLVRGVRALHEFGRLHRDLKPSNVLVTSTARTVLVDFGLTIAVRPAGFVAAQTNAWTGTLAYLAPEVLFGGPVSAAADWYSVGVLLFEALTGRLPYGRSDLLRMASGKVVPPHPADEVDGVPADLDRLIVRLLEREPPARPSAAEIAATFDQRVGDRRRQLVSPRRSELFVGRESERARLHAAFRRARQRCTVVDVAGPAGIGKSELVRRVLLEFREHGAPLVLRSRCHPQEALAFRAFDAIVDRLSEILAAAQQTGSPMPVPAGAPDLGRMFPVLRAVPGFVPTGEAHEPFEARQRAFAALRQLLMQLAQQQPLVLWIDDMHRSDSDSEALLRFLLRQPQAPPMLLLVSHRDDDGRGLHWLTDVEVDIESLPLSPLPPADALLLAQQLVESLGLGFDAEMLAHESHGSPFLAAQLAQHLLESDRTSLAEAATLTLAALVGDRVRRLSGEERRFLEVVSLAGRPFDRVVALRAAGLEAAHLHRIFDLESAKLLRASDAEPGPAVEIYHDRLREFIVAELAPEVLRARHLDIAESLAAYAAQPDELLPHFLAAGERLRALDAALQAADNAEQALAFDRAARLLRQILELEPQREVETAVRARLAEALANAGYGLEAARAFLEAAAAAAQDGHSEDEIIVLRRRAAEHFLRSGHLADGVRVTREVLAAVGIPYPKSAQRALLEAARQRLLLRLRSVRRRSRLRLREPQTIAAKRLLRLDVCNGAAMSLGAVDLVCAEALGVRHLREALACGEPSRIAQALEWEAIKRVQLGGRRQRARSVELLARAEQLAAQTNNPVDLVGLHFARGASHYEAGEWRAAHAYCERAAEIVRDRCRGMYFERVTIAAFAFSSLAHLGDLTTLRLRLPAAFSDADARDDLYASFGLRAGVLALVPLAADRADDAAAFLQENVTRFPNDVVLLQHYLHLLGMVQIDLYQGAVQQACDRLDRAWPGLRRALYLWMASPRVELLNLQGRAWLAAAAAATGSAREKHLKRVEANARALERIGEIASAAPFAVLLRAGARHLRGRSASAEYVAAAQMFDRIEMRAYAAAARWGAGSGEARTARTYYDEQGVVAPERFARVFAPAAVDYSSGQ